MRYCPHCDNELSETFAYILADPNDPRGPRMEVPVIACHGCEYIEEEQDSVSCLLCRETLRLKSSATVELLLWQHQIWMHDVIRNGLVQNGNAIRHVRQGLKNRRLVVQAKGGNDDQV